jgi:hypothetical protein
MPALRRLRCAPASLAGLAGMLRGHRQLCALAAELGGAPVLEQWAGGTLARLPALQRVELSGLLAVAGGGDALLADLGACPGLQELVLRQRAAGVAAVAPPAGFGGFGWLLRLVRPAPAPGSQGGGRFSGAGLLALARSNCRRSLRRLVVDTGGGRAITAAHVAALQALRAAGELPALEVLELPAAEALAGA